MTKEISKELRKLVEGVYKECYGDHVEVVRKNWTGV